MEAERRVTDSACAVRCLGRAAGPRAAARQPRQLRVVHPPCPRRICADHDRAARPVARALRSARPCGRPGFRTGGCAAPHHQLQGARRGHRRVARADRSAFARGRGRARHGQRAQHADRVHDLGDVVRAARRTAGASAGKRAASTGRRFFRRIQRSRARQAWARSESRARFGGAASACVSCGRSRSAASRGAPAWTTAMR